MEVEWEDLESALTQKIKNKKKRRVTDPTKSGYL